MNDIAVLPMIGGHKIRFRVTGDHAYMAMIVRTLLFVSLAFAGTVSYAQQPNPPVLFGSSTTASPVSGNIIFKETFNGFTLGQTIIDGGRDPVADIWSQNVDGSSAAGNAVTILDSNPVIPGGGKYMRPRLVRNGTNAYRSELGYRGQPYTNPRVQMTNVGSDGAGGSHYVAPQDYWYGYQYCLDTYTGTHGWHASQWHDQAPAETPEPDPPLPYVDANPASSLNVSPTKLAVYIEHSEEPDGVDGDVRSGSGVESPNFDTSPVGGPCREIIFNIKQDSRTRAQGGTGKVVFYMGEDSTPKWSWVNRQFGHPTSVGGNTYVFYWNFGGYLSAWRNGSGVNGQLYEARYDNLCVMDSTGSYAAMYACLNDPD